MESIKYNLINELRKILTDENMKNLGQITDLKLHDLYYDINGDDIDNFYNFCDYEYDIFVETVSFYNVELIYMTKSQKHFCVGSNNILKDSYDIELFNNETSLLKRKMLILDNCICRNISRSLNIYDNSKDFDEMARYIYSGCSSDDEIIQEIISTIKSDLLNDLRDINYTYEYIEDFKDKQIGLFMDYKDYIIEE